MRQVLSILIIFGITLHLFSELGIYISFKINQDYIAKNLCVNRDNPHSSCHGCCQLKKRLKTNEEQKQENPQSDNKKQEIQFFSTSKKIVFFNRSKSYKIITPEVIDTGVLLAKSFFRPPKALA